MTSEKASQKQPSGLYVLFFSELWERFSFYGIQAVIVLYLTNYFSLPDKVADAMIGSFMVFGYALPLLGGYLADRVLGYRKAIFFGSLLIVLGNVILTHATLDCVALGLAIVIAGTGLFKPNVSTLLGELYEENDPRRNSGFTLFYMGINIGGMAGPLCYSFFTKYFGWQNGFWLGAIGMLLGMIIFNLYRGKLGSHGYAPKTQIQSTQNARTNKVPFWFYLSVPVAIAIIFYLLKQTVVLGWLLAALGIILLIVQLYIAFNSSARERNNILILILLTIFCICFFAAFQQIATSFALFTDRNVARQLYGFTLPTAMFPMLEPLFVVLLALIFAPLWFYLAKNKKEPSFLYKFVFGLLCVTASVGILTLGAKAAMQTGYCSMMFLVITYFIQAMGDLCLSASGLSAVTVYAPRRLVGFFMGIWFVGIAFGGYFAGAVGKITDVTQHILATNSAQLSATIYYHGFALMFKIGIGICVLAIFIVQLLERRSKAAALYTSSPQAITNGD